MCKPTPLDGGVGFYLGSCCITFIEDYFMVFIAHRANLDEVGVSLGEYEKVTLSKRIDWTSCAANWIVDDRLAS
ncbi:hypothetical protein TrispH2_008394 [Trichoplax sp. H2]|nr:hypothetical protein TrispH2_008394 [Trichoplax sp. H2]|eukprot:RDD39636.1 hypothetical protein TrispH2_008394 [Trichoplax sp. H2]